MQELNNQRFLEACNLVFNSKRDKKTIGTLSEKTLHLILKHYIQPNENNHEIKISNYFVDTIDNNSLIEIQTGNFNILRKKLTYLLTREEKITIVYPIAYVKWLIWIDGETGETTKTRKSPKQGTKYEIFRELYKIKQFLTYPNLQLRIMLINLTEYRKLDGWSTDKKKGSRYERIPKELVEEITVNSLADYQKLMPQDLPQQFTSKDFTKVSKLNLRNSQTALNVLKYIGIVKQTGKKGNLFIYTQCR